MYSDGDGKTHRNLAHIMFNYRAQEGWATETDLRPLYIEWYDQFMKEDTIRRRLDEMCEGGYAHRKTRHFRYKNHSALIRAYKLTKKGEKLIKVRKAA